jgi:hypothetical protein
MAKAQGRRGAPRGAARGRAARGLHPAPGRDRRRASPITRRAIRRSGYRGFPRPCARRQRPDRPRHPLADVVLREGDLIKIDAGAHRRRLPRRLAGDLDRRGRGHRGPGGARHSWIAPPGTVGGLEAAAKGRDCPTSPLPVEAVRPRTATLWSASTWATAWRALHEDPHSPMSAVPSAGPSWSRAVLAVSSRCSTWGPPTPARSPTTDGGDQDGSLSSHWRATSRGHLTTARGADGPRRRAPPAVAMRAAGYTTPRLGGASPGEALLRCPAPPLFRMPCDQAGARHAPEH